MTLLMCVTVCVILIRTLQTEMLLFLNIFPCDVKFLVFLKIKGNRGLERTRMFHQMNELFESLDTEKT
ncbi:hypothetical protein PIB30_099610 [Stylosanthes scabra]|uniref:Uncharacterized protein n=1 Tax=Stylosanthes scabra TaxID=79078 RepID=A0ABU6SXH7_9FABA|nr:hypothetical protein [Stylosanthes scabra]